MFTKSPLNVPKLRFKGFEGEWEASNIQKLFDICIAKDLNKDEYSNIKNNIFKYPIFSNSNKNDGLYGWSKNYQYEKDSITIIARGEIGKIFYRKEEFSAIGRLIILKSNFLNNMFAYYNFLKNLKINVEETSIAQLTRPSIFNIKVHFPKLDEQQKIAKFFSLLDKQIELWNTKLQLSELLLKKIGQNIWKLLIYNEKIKLSYHLSPSIRNPITNIYDKTLISILLYGKGFKKSNLSVKLTNKGRDYFLRNKGELIIGSQNFHNGSVAVLEEDFKYQPIMSSAIFSFDVKNIESKFLSFLLLLPQYQFYLKNNCSGTGQKEFSIKSILNLDFFLIDKNFEIYWYQKICLIQKYLKLIKTKKFNIKKSYFFYIKNMFL